MTEDYTPSILIEPPSEQGLLASLGMFDNYTDSSSECYTQPPTLFIQQPDSLSISTELQDYFPEDKFGYSPSTSGRNSPVGAWSPASSYSGEVFPDEFTHDEYSWPLSGPSSPAHSSSSLSPLTTALDGFALDENYQNIERSVLSGPPGFSRLRSSSHSAPSAELWADSGVGRGRSSSFSGATDSQFYSSDASSDMHISVADVDASLSESLGTGMSWGEADSAHSPLGTLVPGWRYPGRDGPAADTHELSSQPVSPSLLTVPNAGLRRRGACSARRTVSSSDINTLMPPELEQGRGRGQHRTTLSFPNSRSTSNHSRSSSRGVSPHSSYGGSIPSSPAFEDAEAEADLDQPLSIGRRHTFSAIRGPRDGLPSSVVPLSRAISAPSFSKSRRSRGHQPSVHDGLGVFKAEQFSSDSNAFLFPDDSGSARNEFRVSQPTTTPFKAEVASNKIRQASNARRLNAASFQCPLPTCGSTFTARHNLVNHINSHNKHRPHKCSCGMSFTTQGVLNRHKKRCRK